jgi:CubicO group peptidase (beta-lactamase class C family)
MAAPHDLDDSGKPASMPDLFYLPRSCNPFGGVLSSVSDQLTYARFFLGDGRTETGTRLLSEAALHGMWSHPGPGGTLMVELTGFGVSWMVRPTPQGINVIQHGGDLSGYHSGFMMVPERNFAITLLTNCETGRKLVPQLFADDWALQRFAGISNLPAEPKSLTPAELAPYEGTYTAQQIPFKGAWVDVSATIKAADGKLRLTLGEGDDATVLTLPFYKPDYVLLDSTGMRANFVRDANGRVEWFRMGGRLLRHTA